MVNTGMGDEFRSAASDLKRSAADLKSATDVRSAFSSDTPRTPRHAGGSRHADDRQRPSPTPTSGAPADPDARLDDAGRPDRSDARGMTVIPRFLRRSEAERTGTMSVMEHLEELRRRIVISGIAILVGAVVGWFLYPFVLDLLRDPYCQFWRDHPDLRADRHLRPGLQQPGRGVPHQAEDGGLPRRDRRAARRALPGLGVHRAGAHEPGEEVVDPVHRHVHPAVHRGGGVLDLDAPEGSRFPARVRRGRREAAHLVRHATSDS